MASIRSFRVRPVRAVIALALGAVTAASIGWGVVYYGWGMGHSHRADVKRWPLAGGDEIIVEDATTGFAQRYRTIVVQSDRPRNRSVTFRAPFVFRRVATQRPENETAPDLSGFPTGANSCTITECGWPLCCLRGVRYDHIVNGKCLTIDALRNEGLVRTRRAWLPFIPVALPLAADAVVLGAVWYAVLGVPSLIVAMRRKCQGLCTACRYDLSGLAAGAPCPECGSHSKSERVGASHPHEKH